MSVPSSQQIDWKSQHYTTKTSFRVRLKRCLWQIVYVFLFRPTPYFILQTWRLFLVKCFGAKATCLVQLFPSCKIWAPWNLEVGEYVAIDRDVNLYSVNSIKIGNKVAISAEAFICTASHDISIPSRPLITKPIIIENGVWIGARAFIFPGVRIGEGAVIGACAVVTKDVEPWTVVVGNPARFIKRRELKK